ncbi:hypothetical protein Tco_0976091 [Tanacetum coccineum]|uniref:Uncharacterized protein n=1 Tax=Tanacetum coccineum TaxID=301880 RepID=A0ABQ5EG92_9ASTR
MRLKWWRYQLWEAVMSMKGFDATEIIRILAGQLITVAALADGSLRPVSWWGSTTSMVFAAMACRIFFCPGDDDFVLVRLLLTMKGVSSSYEKERKSFTSFDDCLSQGSLANEAYQESWVNYLYMYGKEDENHNEDDCVTEVENVNENENKTDGNDHSVTEENRKGDDLSARRKFRKSNSAQNESKLSESNKRTENTLSTNTAANSESNSTKTESKEQQQISCPEMAKKYK